MGRASRRGKKGIDLGLCWTLKAKGIQEDLTGQKGLADSCFLSRTHREEGRSSQDAGIATHSVPPLPGFFWDPKVTFHYVAQRGESTIPRLQEEASGELGLDPDGKAEQRECEYPGEREGRF